MKGLLGYWNNAAASVTRELRLDRMTLPLRKRQRPGHPPDLALISQAPLRFPEIGIFLVEKRMGSSRRAFLAKLARTKGFRVEEMYNDTVTHVVSEQNTRAEVCEWLEARSGHVVGNVPIVLDVSWFTESMGVAAPVEIEPRHYLVTEPSSVALEEECVAVPVYACQRRTPLSNQNQRFTDALETLAEEASFGSNEGRSLAFSRAASVLRSLPYALTRLEELNSLPGFGSHSKKVLQDMLEEGTSVEVQQVLHSERYRTLKLFTGIFGVGKKTAYRWYQEGLRTLDDLRKQEKKLNREQEAGLLHYADLNRPVSRPEADKVEELMQDVFLQFLPGAIVTLAGGFRRGKESGHDVDFLITHPEEGKEVGLLMNAVSWLSSQGLMLYHHMRKNSYNERWEMTTHASKGRMDHFESCFSIFKLNIQSEATISSSVVTEKTRSWKAVRVDLVIVPFAQYPYALLGWTGSKHFERELRRFAVHERKMILNSHCLYDTTQKAGLPAHCEEDIFAHLGLEYVPPSQRNA
ncbi:DNA-directed DNA/RNA polymerase mu isoform X2 [Ambystoma mexicanum]|uniref:DNA-directed DNA/RNA polymerase mu isoform X2 n=1 Tax=Ambystoma mexicanum TaxID=8296 RepID=UPI0037E89CFE